MLLSPSQAVVKVLNTVEEVSWEPQKEESEVNSGQCLYFSKANGIFSSRIKKKAKRENTAKLENYFWNFCVFATFQQKQKRV